MSETQVELQAVPEADALDLHQQSADPVGPLEPASGSAAGYSDVAPAAAGGPGIIRCRATTKAGKPCVNRAGVDGMCVAHTTDPAVRAMVLAGKAAGGRAPRVRAGLDLAKAEGGIDLRSRSGVQALLEAVAIAVAMNRVSGTQGTVLVAAARTALQAIAEDNDEQIRELAAQLDRLTQEVPRGRR